LSGEELSGGRAVESAGMKLTVVGAVVIVAGVIAAVLLIRYLIGEVEKAKRAKGQTGLP
jgi:hypothetical protein